MGPPEGKRKENERAWRKRERVGFPEALNSGRVCLSFVNTRVCEREGGEWVVENGHVW